MKIEKILVPFDFSQSSDDALNVASVLGRDHAATLHIVHVKEPLTVYHVEGNYDVHPYGDLESLKKAVEKVVPSDPTVGFRHWLMTGDIVKDILLLAKREHVDLIVMGTHGRTGLRRALVGSIAEGVLRQADCPVLIVKRPERSTAAVPPSTSADAAKN